MTSPVSLADAVRQAVLYQLGNIHTSLPAAIVEYDYEKQKASVQPLLNKSWADGTETPMPILNDVPVIFPRAGGGSLTFPVRPGDTCLLVFIERSTDLWKTQGGQVTPDDNRKLDLSDAVAIPGLFPFSESSLADNNDDMLLTYAGSKIRIKSSGDVVIETATTVAIGTQTTELLDILSQLLVLLQGAATVTVPSTPFVGGLTPAFVASVLALQNQLDAIKGTIP